MAPTVLTQISGLNTTFQATGIGTLFSVGIAGLLLAVGVFLVIYKLILHK